MNKNWKLVLTGLLIVHLLLLINLKFTAWPEMTLWPYLILKSWLPYRDIAIAHTPLMLVFIATVYKIFGIGILQLKIFTWILILSMDGLLFWIVKKIWNTRTAVIAVGAFAFWQLFFDGNGLWFDLFMGIPILISYFFIRKKNYLWAGIFWALAFISKQTAVWFLIPIGFEIVHSTKYVVQSFRKLITGVSLVVIPFIIILWILGILPDFYDWAIHFGIFILPKASGQIQLPDTKALAVTVFPFLIFIPLIWKTGKKYINLLLWAVAGVLGTYPRFEYFHLQPAVPFLAIASGMFLSNISWKSPPFKIFMTLYILGCLYLFGGFFMRNYHEGTRFYEQDAQDVVSYVKSNTNLNDRIFIMNWWDNIYALSDRLPAVDPWVPQLSWYMELPGLQDKIVEGLKTSRPKIIIVNPYSESGLSAYIPQKVYDYVTTNYKLKQKVDNLEILISK